MRWKALDEIYLRLLAWKMIERKNGTRMIREKLKHKGIVVDCSGPDGNAFYLLGLAKNLARQLEWSEKETRRMLTEMKSSDYEHLILTFDKYWGWHVTLEFDVHLSSKRANQV